ncbi:lyase family protein [Lentzea nigeriaca]|uniref:lyase family protein n=1 Tax=Lentzea nigeriaca TaxID=1128665 RepID=UPI0019577AFE|nr:lyase family protein [Lentzea nigeriaca]MBM7862771.1 adenylosuccinate lyase [Lentzea nigeriaca]
MRDRIADWVCSLALLASACECLALEVRHGQRSEVAELAEGFAAGQIGSSAMPHKKNPVTAEKICGLFRLVRSYIVPVMEGIPLWHERDISHSSVERVCLPDASMLVEHILISTTGLVRGLVVDESRMRAILGDAKFVISDGAVVALMSAGMRREIAHELVQAAASGDGSAADFAERITAEARNRGFEVDGRWVAVAVQPLSDRLDHVFERVAALQA